MHNDTENDTDNDTDTEHDTDTEYDTDSDTDRIPAGRGAVGTGVPGESDGKALFEAFWGRYPRKAKRVEAKRAWNRLVAPHRGRAEAVAVALERALAEDFRFLEGGGRYIPCPARWLLEEEPWREDWSPQAVHPNPPLTTSTGEEGGSFDTDEFFERALARSYAPKPMEEGEG